MNTRLYYNNREGPDWNAVMGSGLAGILMMKFVIVNIGSDTKKEVIFRLFFLKCIRLQLFINKEGVILKV